MWHALFIGWLAIALAEEVAKDAGTSELTKRQTARGRTLVHGASPAQYTLQSADRVAAHGQQVPVDYQQQSELYVISPNAKPSATALTYSNDSARRLQYIQLSPLHQQLQQKLQQQQLQQQQLQQQQQQLQQLQQQHTSQQTAQHAAQYPAQQQVTYEPEAAHRFYRPAGRLQQQPEARQQEETRAAAPAQYAASAIVDSQLYPQAGSFERELAQLVDANRAQEQKYNAAAGSGVASYQLKKQPGPQQYLKEITRPVARPLAPERLAPQSAPQHVQYQPVQQPQQPQQLYRYVYQPELQQQIQSTSPQQYKQSPEQLVQQYIQAQPQRRLQPQIIIAPQASHAQALHRNEEDTSALRAQAIPRLPAPSAQPEPSRSTIYVSQATPLKKHAYSLLPASVSEREEEAPKVETERLPHRNRPLTQGEFQSLLQAGGYSATLVQSNDPNSPHQEYLLQRTGAQIQTQRPAYFNEKQEPLTYLLPQAHQRPVKRRPIYNVQQA